MTNSFIELPIVTAGSLVTVADVASLPATASEGDIRYVLDIDSVYTYDGTIWAIVAGGGGGGSVSSVSASSPLSVTSPTTTPNITLGIVPVAKGGTNSSAALSNNRVLTSVAGAIVEASAIAASSALSSDSNGLPIASSTTAAELGYVSGVTSAIQTQLNGKQAAGSYITALTGDVTAAGPGSAAAAVSLVGGSTAANVHNAELAANAATNLNTASTIVKRDGSGNFTAGTITAALSGNATSATSAVSFSGSLTGDVTGTQGATVVSAVGTSTAANVHSAELAANAATDLATVSTIVKRDSSGNFAAGVITADLTGNISGTALNVTGVVSVANGGTNSSTSLSNNRIMQSSGGAVVEAAGIGANFALASDANGIPVASATTNTELGYVSGVTSGIQAQFNGLPRDLSATWTSGTSFTVTHNWNSQKIQIEILDIDNGYQTTGVDSVTRPTGNTAVLTSSVAPTGSGWLVTLKEIKN